ncbi:MAG: hypothetical protein GF416_06840 [Candidatus Altiarchaeales archaeon]|nr:hypothetical protein [Candidatus Altiarchaeales archaeon]MBD3416829.1 hypothetical protein [Candidatus Altiarchaeales archaeon]
MKKEKRGLFFTIAVVLLVIPLILFVSYYATVSKTKTDDTISKIRCDELHYFVEDVRGDLERALVIFGRRATIYAIDDVVLSGDDLQDYSFKCTPSCHVNCDRFRMGVNGSEAALTELIMCGTLHDQNISYMVNHTLSQWLDRIESQGRDMHFVVNISLNTLHLIPRDPWTFMAIANTSFNVYDEAGTCYYVGDSVLVASPTSIIGLEDPLFPLNTNSFVIKYINNCTTFIDNEMIAGCSIMTESPGVGQATGDVVFHSTIKADYGSLADYCINEDPDVISGLILVLDQGFGGCNQYEEHVCFNSSHPNSFAGIINYQKNAPESFAKKCNLTIPWITATGDMDTEPPQVPGWDRPAGCDEGEFSEGACIQILNNDDCDIHQVLIGIASNSINTTCYQVSNASAFGGFDGPSFFDRLDGRYNLSDKYATQSMHFFNTSDIGLETLVDPFYLDYHGITVTENATWVDYLYWKGVEGCAVKGVCPSDEFVMRLDDAHAEVLDVDTVCVNVTGCPGSTEVCVDGADDDLDGQPDWLDYDCLIYFTGCGEIHDCDYDDLDFCTTCDSPLPPGLTDGNQVTCDYYGYNTSEWHFYQFTPSSDGLLDLTFTGTSNVTGDDRTDIIIYNYSLDGMCTSSPEVRLNMEPVNLESYCVIGGETYIIALDVDAPRFGYNGSYTFRADLDAGNPACISGPTTTSTTTTSSTTSTTSPPSVCGFFDDMESGEGLWTHGGPQDEWELGDPWWGNAYSGSSCWATDLSHDYNKNANEWLESPEIDLSGVAGPVTLYFMDKYWVVLGAGDEVYVEASSDGNSWDELMSGSWREDVWTQHSYDLSSYAGGSLWVRFRLDSNNDIFTQYGFYVDDFNVTCS